AINLWWGAIGRKHCVAAVLFARLSRWFAVLLRRLVRLHQIFAATITPAASRPSAFRPEPDQCAAARPRSGKSGSLSAADFGRTLRPRLFFFAASTLSFT